MNYLSVCSGIEAASVAWDGLGWQPLAFSEIEKFPSAVLDHHFPGVRNLGDMNNYKDWTFASGTTVDVLAGGTPCQSFSVAGLRKGMDDPRGNLALVYCGILERLKPRWFVWENVPGVLSSNKGRDFGAFLGAVAQLGYGFSWRILDAQFYGVPQRRRRVFFVGHLGDWRHSAAVLFERESMCRHPTQGRETQQEIAKTLRARANSSHREDSDNFVTHSLRGEGFDASEDGTGRGTPLVSCTLPASDGGVSSGMHPVIAIQEQAVSENVNNGPGGSRIRSDGKSYTLEARSKVQAVSFNARQHPIHAKVTPPLDADGNTVGVNHQTTVRRLTPRECERLQGFPDGWTLVDYRGSQAKDGPRYKAIGNSMAVPVMRWIGERIEAANSFIDEAGRVNKNQPNTRTGVSNAK